MYSRVTTSSGSGRKAYSEPQLDHTYKLCDLSESLHLSGPECRKAYSEPQLDHTYKLCDLSESLHLSGPEFSHL